jgi:hypothetical protein
MNAPRALTQTEVAGWCQARGISYDPPARRGADPQVKIVRTSLAAAFRVPQDAYHLALLVVLLTKWFRASESVLIPRVLDITHPRHRLAVVRALGGWPPGWLLPRHDVSARHFVGEWLAMLMALNYQATLIEEDAQSSVVIGDDVGEVFAVQRGRGTRLRRALWSIDIHGGYGRGKDAYLPPQRPDNNEMKLTKSAKA